MRNGFTFFSNVCSRYVALQDLIPKKSLYKGGAGNGSAFFVAILLQGTKKIGSMKNQWSSGVMGKISSLG